MILCVILNKGPLLAQRALKKAGPRTPDTCKLSGLGVSAERGRPPARHLALFFDLIGAFLTLASWEPVCQGASYSHFSEGDNCSGYYCSNLRDYMEEGMIEGQCNGGAGYKVKVN